MTSDQPKGHWCEYALPRGNWGSAVDHCVDLNNTGEFWVGNGEYASRVNFCPFCGAKAGMQTIEEVKAEVEKEQEKSSEVPITQVIPPQPLYTTDENPKEWTAVTTMTSVTTPGRKSKLKEVVVENTTSANPFSVLEGEESETEE